MRRRKFIRKSIGGVALGLGGLRAVHALNPDGVRSSRNSVSPFQSSESGPLHNGIVLPEPFPPVAPLFLDTTQTPYYIAEPPVPIRIDVGRQLFVDDFLVEDAQGLTRTFHRPVVHPSPLVSPGDDEFSVYLRPSGINTVTYFAAPFSDGVWWDTKAQCFRAWLMSGRTAVRLVESTDGVEWSPAEEPGEGQSVMEIPPARDSGTVWIDFEADDVNARYKMSHFNFIDKKNWLYESPDGINWPGFNAPAARTAHYSAAPDVPSGDRTTFFRDPFRGKWVWSLRDIMDLRERGGRQFNRVRKYAETDDLIGDPDVTAGAIEWLVADSNDIAAAGPTPGAAQLYNLDGIAYESLMLFFMTIWSGDEVLDVDAGEALPKRNSVHLGFSRDGFNVARLPLDQREPFLEPAEPGSWMEGNVQSTGGGIVIVDGVDGPAHEELLIYFSGRENRLSGLELERRVHMGLARLRRDGFASYGVPAEQSEEGVLTTRLLRFEKPGGYVFVNADADTADGQLLVEVTDVNGAPLDGFTADDCLPIKSDSTLQRVLWSQRHGLGSLQFVPFRLRFHLRSSRLFSFWISSNESGSSDGYLAAGGPNYPGYRDDPAASTGGSGEFPSPGFVLLSNAPNPFTETTRIQFRIAAAADIDLSLHDATGRLVRTLARGWHAFGLHELQLKGSGLAPGTYFCRLTVAGRSDSIKVVKM